MCEKELLLRSSSFVEFGLDFFFPDSAQQRGGERRERRISLGSEGGGVEGRKAESLKAE